MRSMDINRYAYYELGSSNRRIHRSERRPLQNGTAWLFVYGQRERIALSSNQRQTNDGFEEEEEEDITFVH